MKATTAVSIDGALVDPAAATISVFDRGLLYGDGCFEVLRTWNGIARDLDAHLDRLYDTAAALQLRALDRKPLAEAVYKTIAAAQKEAAREEPQATRGRINGGDHRIRIILTRGPGALSARLAELGPGRAIIVVEPLPPQPPGVRLAIIDLPLARREGRGHKLLAYFDHVIAHELARVAGADEAIRLDDNGDAVEGATCNLFAVLGGTVQTPPATRGVLPGIVRAQVLGLCARDRIRVRERALSLRDLRHADELFVTSSLRGLVGVTALDGASRSVGPVTQHLATAHAAAMRG